MRKSIIAGMALSTWKHYDDVIMTMLASQITSLAVVYSIVYSGVDQRKHQSSASLAFVREIHRGPVNFPQKWPVTRKIFPFDDVIMNRDGGGRGWWDWFTPYLSVLLISCLKRMLKHSCIWCRFYERIRPQSLRIYNAVFCVRCICLLSVLGNAGQI